jgi:hypothetical protein
MEPEDNPLPRQFDVIIERDEEGYYVASVPQLPGCHTQARTLDEATERIREAIELCARPEFGVHWHSTHHCGGMSRTPRISGSDLIAALGEGRFPGRSHPRQPLLSSPRRRQEHCGSTTLWRNVGPGLLSKILRDCHFSIEELRRLL